MNTPLEGCWAKIKRADMHLSFLNERVKSLIVDGGPYKIRAEPDTKTGEIVIYGEAFGEPDVHEWGAIIGDVVHNLRSALDHLVWQLTLAEGHVPPPSLKGSAWKDIRFPIYITAYPTNGKGILIPWATSKEPKSRWGVRTSLRTEFEELQPFNHGQDAPEKPLAILEELWNIDKHRHLHLTYFFVGLNDVTSKSPEFKFRVLQKHPPGPFKGRAEIGRVEQVGARRHLLAGMHVKPHLRFDIAFDQGPPAYGGRVMQKLSELRDWTVAVLAIFDRMWP